MEKQKSLDKRLIAVIVGLIVIIIALCCFLLFRQDTSDISDNDTPRIGYEAEAKVMLDQESLQAAMDAARTRDGNVALRYKNTARSSNGTDFSCYIMNSPTNAYDMFLTIYADAELTDQLYLSGLVPPGSGFEEITLDRELEPGNHTVYVAVTQVADNEETGQQEIKAQVMHTMDFLVSE